MKVNVRQTYEKKLPMKAASILSFCFGQNAKSEQRRQLLIGTYELPAGEGICDNFERSGGICVVNPTNLSAIERHIRLPSGVFRLVKVPSDCICPPLSHKEENAAASVAALTDGRLALLMVKCIDSDDNDSAPFLFYSSSLSSGMLLDCAVNLDGRLVCSDNLGNLSILSLATDGFDSVDFQWRAHSFQFGGTTNDCEVWCCCWTEDIGQGITRPSYSHDCLLTFLSLNELFMGEMNEVHHQQRGSAPYYYEKVEFWNFCQCCASGGEDALLKIWDIRCPTNGAKKAQMTNRSHSAGVVFLASSNSMQKNLGAPSSDCSSAPNSLFSGSYDDHLRAFDLRNFEHPISEIKLNGGVWNVERLSNDLLLVACMYGGWSVVRDFSSPFELIHSHSVHGHRLLYAASSVASSPAFGDDGTANSTIASCTFNDAMLRIEEISFC